MHPKSPQTIRLQTMAILREGILNRRWAGVLPGLRPLAAELGVSYGTLQAALKGLEAEGLLVDKGAGFPREVAPAAAAPHVARVLRVGLLLHEPVSEESSMNQVLLYGVIHALEEGGHRPFFAPKTMRALRNDPEGIHKMMTECAADAWVVHNAGRPLLESLEKAFPGRFIALGGPVDGMGIAAVRVNFRGVTEECVRRLVARGHKRIVLVAPPWHRKPEPSPLTRVFIDAMGAAGIRVGGYHLPDWDYTGESFNALLHALFGVTPPTALIVDDVRQVCAVYAFLAGRRIPPGELALILLGADPALDWMSPPPVCVRYDNEALIRRIVSWVGTLAAGGRDTAQVFCEAHLTGGDITAPPRK